MKDFKLSRRSYDRLTGVDQRLIALAERAIKVSPVDFGIAWMGGRRTAEEQNELFKAGNSKKDGYKKLSKHQSGQAFDVIPFVRGKVVVNDLNYGLIIAAILITAKELGLKVRSGASWKMDGEFGVGWIDLPHLELIL